MADLARFSRKIERHPWTDGRGRRSFQNAQPFLLRHPGLHPAEDPHRITLLETVQRPRRSTRLNMRKRRDRHQLAAWCLDLEIEQRVQRRAILVADLRNDLVTAVVKIEPIHIGPAEQRPQFLTDPGQIEAQVGESLAIEHDPRFRQINLQVGVDIQELAALPTGTQDRGGHLQQLLGRHFARQDQFHIILPGRRQWRIKAREHPQTGDLRHGSEDFAVHQLGRARPLPPVLGHQAAEAAP